jgi:hypothetical protein
MKTVNKFLSDLESLQYSYNQIVVNSPEFVPEEEVKQEFLPKLNMILTEASDTLFRCTKELERDPWKFYLMREVDQFDLLFDNIRVFMEAVTKGYPLVIFQSQLDELSKSGAFDYCVKLSTFFGDKIYEQKILPLLNLGEKFEDERQMNFLTREAK